MGLSNSASSVPTLGEDYLHPGIRSPHCRQIMNCAEPVSVTREHGVSWQGWTDWQAFDVCIDRSCASAPGTRAISDSRAVAEQTQRRTPASAIGANSASHICQMLARKRLAAAAGDVQAGIDSWLDEYHGRSLVSRGQCRRHLRALGRRCISTSYDW